MNNLEQLNNPSQPNVFKDSKQRTREDIVKECKSLKKEILDSITFKGGEYYIEGILADKWIAHDEALNKKDHYWE